MCYRERCLNSCFSELNCSFLLGIASHLRHCLSSEILLPRGDSACRCVNYGREDAVGQGRIGLEALTVIPSPHCEASSCAVSTTSHLR